MIALPLLLSLFAVPAARPAVAPGSAGVAPQPCAAAHAAPLYALLPLRNQSGDAQAPAELAQLLREQLGARGASFVPQEALEQLLEAQRVRYTDSLSVAELAAVRAELGASHVLVGTLFDFERGLEPRVAASLRVLDTASGRRVRSALASLRGADFRGWLGLGAIESIEPLERLCVQRLLEPFDEAGAPRMRAADEGAPAQRIAVLPFVNRSTRASAGANLAEILSHEWFEQCGIDIVEPSELRAALVRARIRTLLETDAQTLASVGRALGVECLALGSVDRLGEDELVHGQRYPSLDLALRIVDARTGLIRRSLSLQRCGAEDETVLGLGAVHDPLELASRGMRRLASELGAKP